MGRIIIIGLNVVTNWWWQLISRPNATSRRSLGWLNLSLNVAINRWLGVGIN